MVVPLLLYLAQIITLKRRSIVCKNHIQTLKGVVNHKGKRSEFVKIMFVQPLQHIDKTEFRKKESY